MHRIDVDTAVASLPTPTANGTPGFWSNGSPSNNYVDGTIADADWFNAIQEELIAVVTAGGITPQKTSRNQVLNAIIALIGSNDVKDMIRQVLAQEMLDKYRPVGSYEIRGDDVNPGDIFGGVWNLIDPGCTLINIGSR